MHLLMPALIDIGLTSIYLVYNFISCFYKLFVIFNFSMRYIMIFEYIKDLFNAFADAGEQNIKNLYPQTYLVYDD